MKVITNSSLFFFVFNISFSDMKEVVLSQLKRVRQLRPKLRICLKSYANTNASSVEFSNRETENKDFR